MAIAQVLLDRIEKDIWEATEACVADGWAVNSLTSLLGNIHTIRFDRLGCEYFGFDRLGCEYFGAAHGNPLICLLVSKRIPVPRDLPYSSSIYDKMYGAISSHYGTSNVFARGVIYGFCYLQNIAFMESTTPEFLDGIVLGKRIRAVL